MSDSMEEESQTPPGSQAKLAKKLGGQGHPITQIAQDLGVLGPTIYKVLS